MKKIFKKFLAWLNTEREPAPAKPKKDDDPPITFTSDGHIGVNLGGASLDMTDGSFGNNYGNTSL